MKHGYSAYANGCRCPECREAKAGYMRGRRARAPLATTEVPEGIKHGTRHAYKENGCRCPVCVTGMRAYWCRERRARRAAAALAAEVA